MIKTDCFAYDDKKCSVLTKLFCKKEACKFYKTREQNTADQVRADALNLWKNLRKE